MEISRRRFTGLAGATLASLAVSTACDAAPFLAQGGARLKARPKSGGSTTARGRTKLGLGDARDAILMVPAVVPTTPMPLMVLFHGAGGSGDGVLQRFGSVPNDAGVAVLSVDSRQPTWDAIRGGFGRDVEFLDRALDKTFGLVSVDPARLAIGGFSDGASYALSVGLANGDLFRRIVAFSPGFIVDSTATGLPRVFVSHGVADTVLPVDGCSRAIVAGLRKRRYDVTYREFDGGHDIPAAIAKEGFGFVAAPATVAST